jgi:acetylornithine/succinyldiaminopimelate/putrescine aminotransferase
MDGIEFSHFETNHAIIQQCIARINYRLVLFAPNCMRIAPPLIVTHQQIETIGNIILESIAEVVK